MVFIVKKRIKGKEYYYLRKSKREKGKIRAITIAYLGKNKEEAEQKALQLTNKNNIKKPKTQKQIMEQIEKKITIDELATFCKRKGFVYPSSEIYGGLSGFWDYGHLGVELKNNIKNEWWNYHVRQRNDIIGMDGSIITNPKVWEASGHVSSFSDIAVICKKCGFKTKIDKSELGKIRCEKCKGEYQSKGDFNLMFITQVGPISEDSIKSYLRPETAQLIFINFKFIQNNARLHLPFGIAQIGKAFRNEIAPRDFLFRCREFEQMEIEYFVNPKEKCPYEIGDTEILVYSAEMQEKNQEAKKMKIKNALKEGIIKTDWHAYWLEQEFLWFTSLGANPKKFRIRQHMKDEKSHYALDTWDLEYEFPFGWKELQGMANRTDFDLRQHEKFSKTDMSIVEEKEGKYEKIIPHVICEPSQGVERAFLVFMFDAYTYDEKRQNIVLKLHPKLAPIKAAVFPIIKKPEYEKISKDIVSELKKEFNVIYDESGSIGRRYARNDEIGTPYCITIDEESIKKKDVTIRDRDTTKQIRVKIVDLKNILKKLINKEISFEKAGKLVETRVKK
ncbi:MAG: glycine--tRNA ligase [Candidatus Pacearchaeota archaeon]